MTDEEKKQQESQENLNALLDGVRMRQEAGLANAVPMLGSMQPPKPKPEPKPCPFCGGNPVGTFNSRAFGKSYWTVGCLVCHVVIDARYDSKEEALAVWNHRVP